MIPQHYSAQHLNPQAVALENASFMRKVYAIMGGGLAITAVTAMVVANSETALRIIFGNRMVFYGLLIAELAIVWTFGMIVPKVRAITAGALFMSYAWLNGVTMSCIFLIYTHGSIAAAFASTAGMFGVMSAYGLVTKRDLTGLGHFAMMGLVGLIIASIVNLFLHATMLHWLITYVGVIVFVCLTAYDTQKIRELNIIGNAGTEEDHKEAIHGALVLYLDFINLFIFMLRILGGRRRD